MKTNPYASKTKAELAALYESKIGYDPFQDDPTLTCERCAEILVEYDEEVKASQSASLRN